MSSHKKIAFVLLLIVGHSNISFGQSLRYFLKLFETKDEKYIALIERKGKTESQLSEKLIDETTYQEYKSKLKERRETEFDLPGFYKSRKAFLIALKTDPIERELNKKVIDDLALAAAGKLYDRTPDPNAFKGLKFGKPKLQGNQKPKIERSSLRTITQAEVYISIPATTEEFKNVFHTTNNNQFESCQKIKQKIEADATVNPRIHLPGSAELLTEQIANRTTDRPVIIIGHNVEGDIHFADGSKKNISELDSLVSITKKTIIYLSCNASNYTNKPAANYYLTYTDGIRLTNKINEALLKNSGQGVNQEMALKSIIEAYGKEKNRTFKLKVAAYSVTISGVGYIIYEIKQEVK